MKIALKIIKAIVMTFLVMALLVVIFQKVTKNKIALGNVYIFQVASGSMEPFYKVGDIIVVKKSSKLEVGDDVTYLGKSGNLAGLTITHRIINVKEDGNNKIYTTKGTANEYEDPEIKDSDIYGKVVYHTVLFSFVGRLMTNIVMYYLLFIAVGVSFAYEVVSSVVAKKVENDEVD